MRQVNMLFLLCVPLLACTPRAAGQTQPNTADLPRYDLPVGRRLTWSTSEVTDNGPPATKSHESTSGTFQATVLRQNPDGSRLMLFRMAHVLTEVRRNGGDKITNPEYVRLSHANLLPDGRMTPNDSLGMLSYAAMVFPPLPINAKQARSGWSSGNKSNLQHTAFHPDAGNSAGYFSFGGIDDGAMIRIYESALSYTFNFNRAKHIVRETTSRRVDRLDYDMTNTSRLKLQSDEMLPAELVARQADDYGRLFAAQDTYAALLTDAEQDPDHCAAHLSNAKDVIDQALAHARTPAVKNEFETMLKAHALNAHYTEVRAQKLRDVLSKPATDWTAADIDGKPYGLAQEKGKVVVLDFWYRACGYCLLAMPQVRDLAEEFKGQPVAIFGMNTDADPDDARFVIDTFKLNYPTLRAGEIRDKYGVIAFPALFIIDRNGIVRHVHIGYSPTLGRDVGRQIRALLAAPSR